MVQFGLLRRTLVRYPSVRVLHDHSHQFGLSLALLKAHRLHVDVCSDFQTGVPKQFLHNLWILSIRVQESSERVPETCDR
jgi:hypothetical protein